MEKMYAYLNVIGRNPLERELEKEGLVENAPFLKRLEKMGLKPCG